MDYNYLGDYRNALDDFEELDRPVPIHPDCLTIKEGDSLIKPDGLPAKVQAVYPDYYIVKRVGGTELYFKNRVTKYPIGSTWHGEEKEGYLIIGEQVK